MTFAGVGTRDAALVYFLAPSIGDGPALALGVFATLRYVVMAIAGLPFVARLPVAELRARAEPDARAPRSLEQEKR